MICYLDTSAFVPLLIDEASSPFCEQLWADADDVLSTHLLYLETASALARATRRGRVTEEQHTQALRRLDRLWQEINVVEPTGPLVRRAAELSASAALRAYDALHCASAEDVGEPDLVFASGDRQLLKACAGLGFHVADVNDPS
ncbi:type II toxin-antitoxin system VapC family toxin [Kribbella sp. NPDC056345]|uniref:type II toxin-antitoxin system VapC family toxin n=1 Tax=Kribbella sp. NPDC056345 TaxID=3345789 RepID=UPI0035DCC4FB